MEDDLIDRNSVSLPDAPAVTGLVFRRFRGPADYAPMVAVREGAREWDRVDPLSEREAIPTTDDLARDLADVPPGTADILMAEVNEQVIGYNHTLMRWTEETGVRVYLHLGYLLPHWRGQGIGGALLHWSQARIAEIVADEGSPEPRTLATNVSSTEREADALIRGHGYVDVRRLSDMALEPLRALPPTSLPPNVVLRPIEPDHYRAIYSAFKDAFGGNWTSTQESEEDYRNFLAENIEIPSFDPSLYHIAWSGEHVVGLVFARIDRGVGMIPQVAVRKAWQRRGIGRVLMIASVNALRDRGLTQVRLFTNAADEQGARSLYEDLGFREVKQHIFYRKPLS